MSGIVRAILILLAVVCVAFPAIMYATRGETEGWPFILVGLAAFAYALKAKGGAS